MENMKILNQFHRFFLRFRYPFSLPEDVATALGLSISNQLSFEEFIKKITNSSTRPTTLLKFMSRRKAEEAFKGATRKEKFKQSSLFSYYFTEGWLEFILHFDEQSRLRRIYLKHIQIKGEDGVEITLDKQVE